MIAKQGPLCPVLLTGIVFKVGGEVPPFNTVARMCAVVTPVAFGWSFPLQVQAGHFLKLIAVAAISLVVAVALPSLRLVQTTPAALLRAQSV